MSRRKTKKQNQQLIKYESNNMSQEQMIEIQTEAYYRALKRIEDEKAKIDAAKEALKEALKGEDIEAIKAKQEELQKEIFRIS